jgi:hypothetical protein
VPKSLIVITEKMDTQNHDLQRLRELRAIQSLNCRRCKPWKKATGPKTLAGKQKVTQNLPHQKDKVGRVIQSLKKLDKALAKLQRTEERSRKRCLSKLENLEKLAKKS